MKNKFIQQVTRHSRLSVKYRLQLVTVRIAATVFNVEQTVCEYSSVCSGRCKNRQQIQSSSYLHTMAIIFTSGTLWQNLVVVIIGSDLTKLSKCTKSP